MTGPLRVVVVGASSGLGRCIGTGLGRRGRRVALLARRKDRLAKAVDEAGEGALAIECDVTNQESCRSAIAAAAADLEGIDAVIYAPGIGPLARLVDTGAEAWRRVLDTNVIGASLVTAAAIPYLESSRGKAIYLSSVNGGLTPPWPGLGAYAVSKAALDKLVEAWRGEHPRINFVRFLVGECAGGDGDAQTEFNKDWDTALMAELAPVWFARGYMTGSLVDVDQLVAVMDTIVGGGPSMANHTVTVASRPAE